jgi:hypothetical protein
VFLAALPVGKSAAQDATKPVAFLIQSLKTYRAKFDTVEGDFTYRIMNSQQALISTDHAHWQQQNEKERLDVVEVPGADPNAKGKLYENFSFRNQTAIFEPEQKRAILRPDRAYLPLAYKPDEMLLLSYQGRPLPEYLEQPQSSAHVLPDAEVNKLACEVVQFDLVTNGKPGGYDVRLYFAPALGDAPVKLTVDDKQGDVSSITLQYSSADPGGPTPELATYEVSSNGHQLSEAECHISKLVFNPPPADLAFKLPSGTLVNDMINKKHYVTR